MTILIIGYPDSGKSAAAENMAVEMSPPCERIYLATMIPFGEDGAARIEKHRTMRDGKGFTTIEAPFDIDETLSESFSPDELSGKTVLLECLSNLVANELFERKTRPDVMVDRLLDDIRELSEKVKNLIIVSNHFELTDSFDEETIAYSKTLDLMNGMLAPSVDKLVRI